MFRPEYPGADEHDVLFAASEDGASHARKDTARPKPRRAERVVAPDGTASFLATQGLSPLTLDRASQQARHLGVSDDAALLAQRAVGEDDFYRALARHLGTAFVSRGARIAPGVDIAAASGGGAAPLQRWPGAPRWILAPRGRAIRELAAQGSARDAVITSPRRLDMFLRDASAARIADAAVSTLSDDDSARRLPAGQFWTTLAILVACSALLAWLSPRLLGAAVTIILWFVFLAACMQRIVAVTASFEPKRPLRLVPDIELPTYTIVIALYREARMAGEIVMALENIDYPRAKLDIKFVVENDDTETRDALARVIPSVEYDIIVAPDGHPRTKPRALNVALPFARGEFITIYDAEDRPHPQQLRRAAAAFAAAPSDVACLQAQLAIDNESKGWLQAIYALDYAALFDVLTPGLAFYELPVFLGGSSNHFHRERLTLAGGWDAWNVTEDADLGVRLARHGWRVATFASRTDEEAPVTLRSFFAQRVRWKKGWLQTFAVHLREPKRLLRDLGWLRFVSVLTIFAAGLLGPLLWPVFTGLLLHDAFLGDLLEPVGVLASLRTAGVGLLVYAGLLATLAPLVIGALRNGLKRDLVFLPLLPVWHVLLCLAAWWAIVDLLRAPHRWSKTEHGLARRAAG